MVVVLLGKEDMLHTVVVDIPVQDISPQSTIREREVIFSSTQVNEHALVARTERITILDRIVFTCFVVEGVVQLDDCIEFWIEDLLAFRAFLRVHHGVALFATFPYAIPARTYFVIRFVGPDNIVFSVIFNDINAGVIKRNDPLVEFDSLEVIPVFNDFGLVDNLERLTRQVVCSTPEGFIVGDDIITVHAIIHTIPHVDVLNVEDVVLKQTGHEFTGEVNTCR